MEAWASSGLPDAGDGRSVVVRARGTHIQVEEQRPRRGGGITARPLVRFRYLDRTGTWALHRAAAGGRWISTEPIEGDLVEVLESIDLRALPGLNE